MRSLNYKNIWMRKLFRSDRRSAPAINFFKCFDINDFIEKGHKLLFTFEVRLKINAIKELLQPSTMTPW